MSLMECPECGHDMSSLAEACPNCGYKLVREETINHSKEEKVNYSNSNNNDYMGSFVGGLIGYSLLRSLFRPRWYGRGFFGPGPMGPGPMGGHGRGPRF